MIRSFKDKRCAAILTEKSVKRLAVDLQRNIFRKLRQIDSVDDVEELRVPPGNRLKKLVGDRAGQYSIRINQQWRICFDWIDGHAENVELVDYH
jgi:proteic killer suppression protein